MWRGKKSFHRFFWAFLLSRFFGGFLWQSCVLQSKKNQGTVSKNNVTSQRFKLLQESFFVRYFIAHVECGGTDRIDVFLPVLKRFVIKFRQLSLLRTLAFLLPVTFSDMIQRLKDKNIQLIVKRSHRSATWLNFWSILYHLKYISTETFPIHRWF